MHVSAFRVRAPMSRREQPIYQEDVPDDRDHDQQEHTAIRDGAREYAESALASIPDCSVGYLCEVVPNSVILWCAVLKCSRRRLKSSTFRLVHEGGHHFRLVELGLKAKGGKGASSCACGHPGSRYLKKFEANCTEHLRSIFTAPLIFAVAVAQACGELLLHPSHIECDNLEERGRWMAIGWPTHLASPSQDKGFA